MGTRDAFRRETFALPREAAREKAREIFRRFPKAAYMTEIESWRVLPAIASNSPCGVFPARIEFARGARRPAPRTAGEFGQRYGGYGRATSTIFHGLMMSTIFLSSGFTINSTFPSVA